MLCNNCGTFNAVRPQLCDNCGEPVGLKHKHDQQECQERGMSYSVPLKVKIRLTVYDKDPETERLDDPRHQGRGRFLRRNPADDRQRNFHHQRHGARHRLAASSLARRLLQGRPRSTSPRSFRIAARGSSSNTTRRTFFTCASASARSWRRSSCARWASGSTRRSI